MEGSTRVKLLLFLLGFTVLVGVLLYIASVTKNQNSASTTTPATFTNPFDDTGTTDTNPFATESSYQNPFGSTEDSYQEYTNPFENLQ